MKTVQQLSVFLENKVGTLNKVLEIISEAGIDIISSSLSDTSDFAIFRLVTNDTEKALQLLQANNINASIYPVLALSVDTAPGSLYKKIRTLSEAGINIQYMYSVSSVHKAFIILKVYDLEAAEKVIAENNIPLFTLDDLK